MSDSDTVEVGDNGGSGTDEQTGERRVGVLELFFDLVFVLAITQVTAYLASHLNWRGVAEGLIILGLMWWAWVGYSWLTNSVDSDDVPTRLTIFTAMAALVVVALAMPGAFGDEALLMACAYGLVRAMQVGLYAYGTDRDDPNHGAILKLAPGFMFSSLLLIVGALIGGDAQIWIWLAALLIDVATPFMSDTSDFRVHAGHFAERHGLIVIIALGESIVALSAAASGQPLNFALVAGVTFGVAIAASLWWTYFDVTAVAAEQRLASVGPVDRARLARDAYSVIHLPMIAGVVLLALGLKKALGHADHHLEFIPALALVGGPALYLLGQVAFRYRNIRTVGWTRLVASLLLLLLLPVALAVPALAAIGIVLAVVGCLVAYEAIRFAEIRKEIRDRAANGA
ncbi:MAG: low temperature requirement protein A [Solirubrobacterales bacterium]|nr:low temperature requirement protein A [Solirubrobacterales bacterium]